MHTLCLSLFLMHTHSAYIHTLHTYLVCVDRKLLSTWLVHRILAAFVVSSPTLSKKHGACFLFLFFCTDITNGYFNWNFWHCLHLVLEWQTSEWLARPGPGWLVCSEAYLNQLAAWIACLILTGIHWNPWQCFFLNKILSLEKLWNNQQGRENTSCFLEAWLPFCFVGAIYLPLCKLTFWCFYNVTVKWQAHVVAVLQQ